MARRSTEQGLVGEGFLTGISCSGVEVFRNFEEVTRSLILLVISTLLHGCLESVNRIIPSNRDCLGIPDSA